MKKNTGLKLVGLAIGFGAIFAVVSLLSWQPANEAPPAPDGPHRVWYEAIWHELVVEPAVRPPAGRSAGEVILWWEDRRGRYNLFVIITALAAALVYVIALGFAKDKFGEAMIRVVILVASCNIWYTGGWLAELLLRLVFGDAWLGFGPAAFVAGEAFSLLFNFGLMFLFPD